MLGNVQLEVINLKSAAEVILEPMIMQVKYVK